MLDSTNRDPDFTNTIITGDESWVDGYILQWKSDESTKLYLTQMLPAINWRYWQWERIHAYLWRVQGRLMQARFIEIHQVFAEKQNEIGHFSNIILVL